MASQLKFLESPNQFHLALWRDVGRHLLKAHGQIQWDIGDWLIAGEDDGKLSDADLKRFALTATSYRWAWQTLKNFKVTARAIPASRRRDGRDGQPELSYSMHVEIAKFEDAEIQERLLVMATTERSHALGADHMETARFKCKDGRESFHLHVSVPMSVKDLKTCIRDMQKRGELPLSKKISAPPVLGKVQPWERKRVVPVKFTILHHDFLKAALSKRPYDAGGVADFREFVHKLVCDYVQQNFGVLLEYAKKHDARWGTHLLPELSQILSEQKYPQVVRPQPSPAKPKREAEKRKNKEESLAVEDEKRRAAGQPTQLQYQGFTMRCTKLVREYLPKAGKDAPKLLLPYLRKVFGVKDLSPDTTSLSVWESTLGQLENAGSPAAVVEILKS